MIRNCSHPTCRTSLDDESAVYCDHSMPFCHLCEWADGCDECHINLLRARADAAWNAEPVRNPVDLHDADWLHELRAEQRNYEYAQLIAREEERRAG